MNDIFLGKPDSKTENFIKDQWCDIFIKDDGTKVRSAYDASKTMVNLYAVEDYENVKHFSFGKSYTKIRNIYYQDKPHGIDLSRTKIEISGPLYGTVDLEDNSLTSFSLPDSMKSFSVLYLNSNQLTDFSLPDSLESFDLLDLTNNQLTAFSLPASLSSFNALALDGNSLSNFSLPDSLQSFYEIYLNSNSLSNFSLPASLSSFNTLMLYGNSLSNFSLPDSLQSFDILGIDNECNLDCTACTSIPHMSDEIYDYNGNIWQGTVLVRDDEQKAAFEADEKWKQYRIEVK